MSDKRLLMGSELAQFVLKWTYLGQQCRNIMYAVIETAPDDLTEWTDADAAEAGDILAQNYKSAYQGSTAHDATLDGIDWVWNFAVGTGPLHEGSTLSPALPFTGGETHDGCANNVSLAIKLGTGLGGRSNHGRFYFVGVNNGLYDVDNPNVLKSGSATAFATNNANFQGDMFEASLSSGNIFSLAVASFVANGSARVQAVANKVTAISLTDNTFDSQRRRLPGRGS